MTTADTSTDTAEDHRSEEGSEAQDVQRIDLMMVTRVYLLRKALALYQAEWTERHAEWNLEITDLRATIGSAQRELNDAEAELKAAALLAWLRAFTQPLR